MQLHRNRSENDFTEPSVVIHPLSNGHLVNSNGASLFSTDLNSREWDDNLRLNTQASIKNGFVGDLRRRHNGTSDFFNDNRFTSDILAQSVRRQSLKGTKQSLSESNLGSISEVLPSATLTFVGFRARTPENGGESGLDSKNSARRTSVIPSSHEDIQILNLQGFMDFTRGGESGKSSDRKRHRKKRNKINDSYTSGSSREGTKAGLKSRDRKRRGHRRKRDPVSEDDDDDEMMLKDLDDIDDKISGLVLGPKVTSKESVGKPITLEEASTLRSLITGSPSQTLPTEWMTQNFLANSNPNLSYGLVQKKVIPFCFKT